MRASGLAFWLPLLARYATGQLAIQAANLLTGFLILRLLSIEQYAIYILAALLQSVASIGSDLGVSQGVISIGAPLRGNRALLGALLHSAFGLRKRLFVFVVPVVVLVGVFLLRENATRWEAIATVTMLALAIAWVQQSASISTAALNAHHDSRGLVRAGLAHALSRLAVVGIVCSLAPYAVAALAANLVGAVLHAWLLRRACAGYLADGAHILEDYRRKLVAFIKPLLPGIAYYLVQGQIATFLLAWAGATVAVAEVGALGRLGQIIALLGLLNGFFIQPYFARIADRRLFAVRAAQVVSAGAIAFALITISALIAPGAWLAILGASYRGLEGELAIALAGAQLAVAGAALYTIVIATGRTQWQWLQIALGLVSQLTYVALVGVDGTRQALILNLIPAAVYLVLQAGLLAYILTTWDGHARAA